MRVGISVSWWCVALIGLVANCQGEELRAGIQLLWYPQMGQINDGYVGVSRNVVRDHAGGAAASLGIAGKWAGGNLRVGWVYRDLVVDETPVIAFPLPAERIQATMQFWYWEPEFDVRTPRGWLPFEIGSTVGFEFRREWRPLRDDGIVDQFGSVGLLVAWKGFNLRLRHSESLGQGAAHHNSERSHTALAFGYDFRFHRD